MKPVLSQLSYITETGPVKVVTGAENGARTRGLNLGKVALYQLSYFRKMVG